MQAFIKNGNYFELTDYNLPFSLPEGAVEVPLRPSPEHVWTGAAWELPLPTAPDKPQLLAMLADVRWQRETGGIVVDAMAIPTDDRAKLLISLSAAAAVAAAPESVRLFKISGSFVTLTNAQLVAIHAAIAAHVQQCFDAEAVVAAQIQAEEVISAEDVAGAFDAAFDGESP